jgi:hypothetical protein
LISWLVALVVLLFSSRLLKCLHYIRASPCLSSGRQRERKPRTERRAGERGVWSSGADESQTGAVQKQLHASEALPALRTASNSFSLLKTCLLPSPALSPPLFSSYLPSSPTTNRGSYEHSNTAYSTSPPPPSKHQPLSTKKCRARSAPLTHRLPTALRLPSVPRPRERELETVLVLPTLRLRSVAIQTRLRTEGDAAVAVEDEEAGAEEATRRRRVVEVVEATRVEIGVAKPATTRGAGADGATMRREG